MSTYQFGWVRSYRQALERLIAENADNEMKGDDWKFAQARLSFTADMWQTASVAEVIADMAVLRREMSK